MKLNIELTRIGLPACVAVVIISAWAMSQFAQNQNLFMSITCLAACWGSLTVLVLKFWPSRWASAHMAFNTLPVLYGAFLILLGLSWWNPGA